MALGVDLAPGARLRRTSVDINRHSLRLHVHLVLAQAGHPADVTVALYRLKDSGLVLAEILQALRARVHIHRMVLLVRFLVLHLQSLWILLRMTAAKHALFARVLASVACHGCTLALLLHHAGHLPRRGHQLVVGVLEGVGLDRASTRLELAKSRQLWRHETALAPTHAHLDQTAVCIRLIYISLDAICRFDME